jgi:hypothetical protein
MKKYSLLAFLVALAIIGDIPGTSSEEGMLN